MLRNCDAALSWLARKCAVLGGLVLLGIMLVTCLSVLGRDFFELTLVGDFELVGLACGVAVTFFLPWCQLRRGHIVVDYFSAGASAGTVAALDRLGALLLAVAVVVLAWRTAIGGWQAHSNFSSSMLLGIPHWWVYAGMVPPLLLTAALGLRQALGRRPLSRP